MIKKISFWVLTILLLITCIGCNTQKHISNYDWYNKLGQALGLFEEKTLLNDKIDILNDYKISVEVSHLEDRLVYDIIDKSYNDYFSFSPLDYHLLDDYVNSDDFNSLLDSFIKSANNKEFEEVYDYEYKEAIYYIQDYEYVDDYVYFDDDLEVGSYISFHDELNLEVFKITEKSDQAYKIESAQLEDVYESLKISGSHQLNLKDAIIEPYNEEAYVIEDYTKTSSTTKSFEYDGYKVSYSIINDGFKGHISKNNGGINYYADFTLNSLKTSYKWDYSKGNIKEAYFKLDYNNLFNVGLAKTRYFDYGFTKKISFNDLMPLIKDTFNIKDELECIIPVVKVKVPLPQTFVMDISLALELHVYASGKVELKLSNSQALGMEIVNNRLRLINDSTKDIDASFKASGNASIGIRASLNAFSLSLLDVGAKAGIKGLLSPIIHLYNNEEVVSTKENIDIESLEKLNDDRLGVCADFSLHWFVNIYLNSSRSLAGKIGISLSKDIMDDQNQLFNNPYTHLENWQFVPTCTKNKRLSSIVSKPPLVENIELSTYQMMMSINQELVIPIKQLPSDLNISDLEVKCMDNLVCKVANNKVVALASGQTSLIIKSKDNHYQAIVHIIVELC